MICGAFVEVGAEGEESPQVVGVKKCKGCHKPTKIGNQFGLWSERAHSRAFETLASEQSVAIATEMGLGNPQEAAECLVCHTTQGVLGAEVPVAATYANSEGVGCEACHGPGSEYKSNKVMKDHAAAVAAGLVEITEEHCLLCHNEQSPTYQEFVYEEALAVIAHPVPE